MFRKALCEIFHMVYTLINCDPLTGWKKDPKTARKTSFFALFLEPFLTLSEESQLLKIYTMWKISQRAFQKTPKKLENVYLDPRNHRLKKNLPFIANATMDLSRSLLLPLKRNFHFFVRIFVKGEFLCDGIEVTRSYACDIFSETWWYKGLRYFTLKVI